MKCVEYFYNKHDLDVFINSLPANAEPEIVEDTLEDDIELVYVVYFNPPEV